MILLHGHSGSAAQVFGQNGKPSPLSAWRPIAERGGLILVAPDGATDDDGRQGWNDCRKDAVENRKEDDVRFIRDIIARMAREEGIDAACVYVMGMSNGGMMAFRLALELDPPIAAASSSMANNSLCGESQYPISALLIDGTDDPIVPYGGGQVSILGRKRGAVIGVEQSAEFWRHADRIMDEPVVEELKHLDGRRDHTRAVKSVYGSTAGAPQVELIRIDGGGHIEPSITQHYGAIYGLLVGHQNHDFESAEVAWQFFSDKRAAH